VYLLVLHPVTAPEKEWAKPLAVERLLTHCSVPLCGGLWCGAGGLFVVCPETGVNLFMTSQKETGPQYPAQEGSKISGDPARSVAAQGAASGSATCDPAQAVGVYTRQSG